MLLKSIGELFFDVKLNDDLFGQLSQLQNQEILH